MTGLQVKDSMQQQEQAAKAPLQQPLRQQSVCSSPKQASNLSEKRSLCAAAATNTEHGSFADLSKEAADAKYKVQFAAACLFLSMLVCACTQTHLCLLYSVYMNAVRTCTSMCSTLPVHIPMSTHITLKSHACSYQYLCLCMYIYVWTMYVMVGRCTMSAPKAGKLTAGQLTCTNDLAAGFVSVPQAGLCPQVKAPADRPSQVLLGQHAAVSQLCIKRAIVYDSTETCVTGCAGTGGGTAAARGRALCRGGCPVICSSQVAQKVRQGIANNKQPHTVSLVPTCPGGPQL